MREAFVGIDVACAKGKYLPIVICCWRDGRLVPEPLRELPLRPPQGRGNVATLSADYVAEFADQAAVYIESVCHALSFRPVRIAIDAPSAPRSENLGRRLAEQGLDAAGISCIGTPSASEFGAIESRVRRHLAQGGAENRMPHANQLWMLVGFRLFERLARLAPCIEVFPQATARVMGEGGVHKSKAQGLLAQLAKVASFTGWPAAADVSALAPIGFGSSHDKLDAYLSAWVAALTEDQRIAFGEPPDDAIWVPRTSEVRFDVPVVHRAVSKPQKRSDEAHRPSLHARPCPACGTHTFKRWPWGWDAHAAHKCAGLIGHGAEERKREFRRRFRSLFSG